MRRIDNRSINHFNIFLRQFIEQKAWIAENFPKDKRFEYVIITGDNVLTAETFSYVRQHKLNIPH